MATNSNSRGGSNSNRRNTKLKVAGGKQDYKEDEAVAESPSKMGKTPLKPPGGMRASIGNQRNDPELLKLIEPDEWNNIPLPVCKAIKDIISELLICIHFVNKNDTELKRQSSVQQNMKTSLEKEINRKFDQASKDGR